MLNPPGPASVPSLHIVPSAPTPMSVAPTPSGAYARIGANGAGPGTGMTAGAEAGVGAGGTAAGGVGAAIAVPGGAGEAISVAVGAGTVGVGGGGEVDRGVRRDLPGGTFTVGLTGGGADSAALMTSEVVCWIVLATAQGETALARFAEPGSRFDLPVPATGATEASSRGAASRVTTQAIDARFRTGFDWSIFTPGLFPARFGDV